MNIQLDKKQYHTLLTALQTAGFVYGIMGDMVDSKYKKRSKQLDDLENIVLEHADEYGMGEFVEIFEGTKYLNEKFMEKVIQDLKEYEDYVFWDMLAREMAKKEFHTLYTDDELKQMEERDLLHKIFDLEEKYHEIFEEVGIDNLELVNYEK